MFSDLGFYPRGRSAWPAVESGDCCLLGLRGGCESRCHDNKREGRWLSPLCPSAEAMQGLDGEASQPGSGRLQALPVSHARKRWVVMRSGNLRTSRPEGAVREGSLASVVETPGPESQPYSRQWSDLGLSQDARNSVLSSGS